MIILSHSIITQHEINNDTYMFNYLRIGKHLSKRTYSCTYRLFQTNNQIWQKKYMFSESRKQTNTYLTTEKINFQLKYARNTCQRKHSPQ